MADENKPTPYGAKVMSAADEPSGYISAPGYPDIEEMMNRPYNADKAAEELGLKARGDVEAEAEAFWNDTASAAEAFWQQDEVAKPTTGKKAPQAYKMDNGKLVPMTAWEMRGYNALASFSSTVRGVGEFMGLVSEETNQKIEDNQKAIDESGVSGTTAASVAGYLAEPVGFIAGAGKAKTAWDLAKLGAKTGAVVGFFDPNSHDLGERLRTALVAGGVGAVLTPALGKTVQVVAKKIGAKISHQQEIDLNDVLDGLPTNQLSVETVKRAAVIAEDINTRWMPGDIKQVKRAIRQKTAANEADYATDVFNAANDAGPDTIDYTAWYLNNLKSLEGVELARGAAPFNPEPTAKGGMQYLPPILTREQFVAHKMAKGIPAEHMEATYQAYVTGAKLRGGTFPMENPAKLKLWERIETERAVQKASEMNAMQAQTPQVQEFAQRIAEKVQHDIAGKADLVTHGTTQVTPQKAMEYAFEQAAKEIFSKDQAGYITAKVAANVAGTVWGAAGGYVVGGEEGALAGALIGAAGAHGAFKLLERIGKRYQIPTKVLTKEVSEQSLAGVERLMDNMGQAGIKPEAAYKIALEQLNLTHEQMQELVKEAGRKIRISPYNVADSEAAVAANRNIIDISVPKTADILMGSMSTRLRKMAEPLFGRMRKYEFDILRKSSGYIDKAAQFTHNLPKVLTREDYQAVHKALLNQDFASVDRIVAGYNSKPMAAGWEAVKDVLTGVREELASAGHTFENIKDYFPRVIIDRDGLINALPKKDGQTLIKKMFGVQNNLKRELTMEEEGALIDQYLRGLSRRTTDRKLGASLERQIDTIPDELLQFYATPEAALNTHIRRSIIDAESRKLFGRFAENGVGGVLHYQKSIGNMMAQMENDPNLNEAHLESIRNILLARMEATHKVGFAGLVAARNLLYAMTLGNPVAAATQIGDLAMAGYAHGAINMARAVVRKITGQEMLSRKDMGLHDLTAELASTDVWSKTAKRTLTWFGMDAMDRIGKEVNINAAYIKNQNLTRTAAGLAKLEGKWKKPMEAAGVDFNQMVRDLRDNRVTEDIRFLMFNELSDLQPTTLLEMPEAYASHPNGRMAYALKSWTLKQLDIARRDIFQQLKSGNIREGGANAARFAAYVGMGGVAASTVQDLLLQKDVRIEDIPDKAISQLWKNFGASDMLLKQIKNGEWDKTVGNILLPPIGIAQTMWKDFTDGNDTLDASLQYLPGIGKLMYWWGPEHKAKYREQQLQDRINKATSVADERMKAIEDRMKARGL